MIPSFIYKFQEQLGSSVTGWNEPANKMVQGEAKIKDVCAECNNGVLADLDAYGKQMLVDSSLLVQNYTKHFLTLKYQHSLLLRWLLKLSFNSSRTDGVHAPIFQDYIPFILGLAPAPRRYEVATLLYMAAPSSISPERAVSLPFLQAKNGCSLLNPFLVRISYGALHSDRYVHRVIFFGPAVLQLVLFRAGVLPGHAASDIRSLIKRQPGAVELSAKRTVVSLDPGQQSWLDLYEPQVLRTSALAAGGG